MHRTSTPFLSGGHHVVLCSAAAEGDVAFGLGLALARAAGDQREPPEWVQLLPAGPAIITRDKRKFTLADPRVLVAAFLANQADLPLDIEHASEIKAPKGEEAPAQAWLTEIAVRDDGTTWGRLDWTAHGADLWRSGSYRYLSPAFLHTKAGEIVRLTSAALVTRPALQMPALAREGGENPHHLEPDMTVSALATLLISALSLKADATDAEIVAAATTHVALAREARDPTKLVPKADLDQALARATTAEGKIAEADAAAKEASAVAAVDAAVTAGKISPAGKDHWLAIARDNPEAFQKAVASMAPVTTPTGAEKKAGGAAETDEHGLTLDQLAMCATLGVAPADFASNLPK